MKDLPLFDHVFAGPPVKPVKVRKPTGLELKAEGMESVLDHTPEHYKSEFKHAIESLSSGTEFTAEDVRAKIGDPPESVHYNCFGALMAGMAKRKVIKATGRMVASKRVSLHASLIAVWVRQ